MNVKEPRKVSALIGAAPPIAKGGLMYVMNAVADEGYIRPAFVEPGHVAPRLTQYSDHFEMTSKGWERYEVLTKPKPSAVPYSPREVPMAIDFLNSVWKEKNGEPLMEIRSVEIIASLGFPCADYDEFSSRLGDLGDLLRWIDVRDDQLPSDTKIKRAEKLNRLQAFLRSIAFEKDSDDVVRAIGALKDLVIVRNRLTHKGSPELISALARLGIDFPIEDYALAWDTIRGKAAESLNLIRKIVQAID
ncbi:MAG: hypothetical protein Q7S58_01710 [Candidatus Binatus sp.]|uniref:hypothetical protein n=1 Tax=Candidatus Binatus sp. TaxID=2811406 RepID=UPI002725EC87|nr:hypothetical protein [Candidatus Binatus sp.]MDO8431106.1 hypothetical protein [Candidatus Binatus sp.]